MVPQRKIHSVINHFWRSGETRRHFGRLPGQLRAGLAAPHRPTPGSGAKHITEYKFLVGFRTYSFVIFALGQPVFKERREEDGAEVWRGT